jgi:FtsP/CotA-like multicopper oxidase with cupredoxin domain
MNSVETAIVVRLIKGSPKGREKVLHLWQGRPALLAAALGTSAAIAAAAIAPGVASAVAVSMAPPPTTAQQEAGMTPGLPLRAPTALNTATPRTLRLRLVAEPKRFDISGKRVWGESYNGHYVGPTMHLVPGEHVKLTLVNRLTTPTNLHFHGLHVSPSGSADNPEISVLPGRSFTYHLYIPLDQPLGTFWYHDHEMCMGNETMHMTGMTASATGTTGTTGTTGETGCQDVETQIYDGLAGTIIVGDDRALLPQPLRHVATRTLALKDMQITGNGHIVANTPSYYINPGNPTVRLVNGQLQPVLHMRPGQTQLWRIANEGADIFYGLKLPGYTFTIVGRDGYPVSRVTRSDLLYLPPAARWDVLVTASTRPGSTWLETLPLKTGPAGESYPMAKLMKIRVAGRPERPLPMPVGALPAAPASLATADIAANRVVRLSENAAGTEMYINGKQFNPDTSVFSTPALLGTTEQWTVVNDTGEIHPFHTHTEHFQVMSVNGVPQLYAGEQDIVPVPSGHHGKPGEVVIRIRFTDFTGKVMFHCHIAAHEDAGMMSFVNVIAASSAQPSTRQ